MLKYIQEMLSYINNEDWSFFIEEKNQTSRLGVRPVELGVDRLTIH